MSDINKLLDKLDPKRKKFQDSGYTDQVEDPLTGEVKNVPVSPSVYTSNQKYTEHFTLNNPIHAVQPAQNYDPLGNPIFSKGQLSQETAVPFTSTREGAGTGLYRHYDIDQAGGLEKFSRYGIDATVGRDHLHARAKNQSTSEQVWNSIKNTVAGVPLGIIENLGYMGTLLYDDGDYENSITQWAKGARNWWQENVGGEVYRLHPDETFSWGDSAWWLQHGQGLVESIGEFAALGMGVGGAMGKAARIASALTKAGTGGARLTNAAAQVATSGALAYTEGALTGAQVYQTIYEEQKRKGVSNEEALRRASVAAATTVKLNTAVNTLINIPSVAPLFRNNKSIAEILGPHQNALKQLKGESREAAVKRIMALQAPQITRRELLTSTGRESLLEGFEETVNVWAEASGMRVGRRTDEEWANMEALKLSDGFLKLDELGNYANDVFNEEGALNFILGAAGGLGQNVIMENVPWYREKAKARDEKVMMGPDGKPVTIEVGDYLYDTEGKHTYEKGFLGRISANKKSNIEKEIQFNKIRTALVSDINEVDQKMNELSNIIENKDNNTPEVVERMANQKREELFSLGAYRSIRNGTGENLIETFNQIRDVDNTIPISEKAIEKIESLEKLLTEEQSKPEEEQDAKVIENIENEIKENEKIARTGGVTQAMLMGLASSPNDNKYKETADKSINTIKTLTNTYNEILKKYDYGDEESYAFAKRAFLLKAKTEFSKSALADSRKKIDEYLSNIRENLNEKESEAMGALTKAVQLSAEIDAIDDIINDYRNEFKSLRSNPESEEFHQVMERLRTRYPTIAKATGKTTDEIDNALIEKFIEDSKSEFDSLSIKRDNLNKSKEEEILSAMSTLNKDSIEGMEDFAKGSKSEHVKKLRDNVEKQIDDLRNSIIDDDLKEQYRLLRQYEADINLDEKAYKELTSKKGRAAFVKASKEYWAKVFKKMEELTNKKKEEEAKQDEDIDEDTDEDLDEENQDLSDKEKERIRKEKERAKKEGDDRYIATYDASKLSTNDMNNMLEFLIAVQKEGDNPTADALKGSHVSLKATVFPEDKLNDLELIQIMELERLARAFKLKYESHVNEGGSEDVDGFVLSEILHHLENFKTTSINTDTFIKVEEFARKFVQDSISVKEVAKNNSVSLEKFVSMLNDFKTKTGSRIDAFDAYLNIFMKANESGIRVKVVDKAPSTFKSKSAPAFFIPKENTIYVVLNNIKHPHSSIVKTYLVHETIHGLLSDELRKQTAGGIALINETKALIYDMINADSSMKLDEVLMSLMNDLKVKIDNSKDPKLTRMYKAAYSAFKYSYDTFNKKGESIAIEEFITQALSNKDFASYLNSIPSKDAKSGVSTSVWEKLKMLVLYVVDYVTGGDSKLQELVNILDRNISSDLKDNENYNRMDALIPGIYTDTETNVEYQLVEVVDGMARYKKSVSDDISSVPADLFVERVVSGQLVDMNQFLFDKLIDTVNKIKNQTEIPIVREAIEKAGISSVLKNKLLDSLEAKEKSFTGKDQTEIVNKYISNINSLSNAFDINSELDLARSQLLNEADYELVKKTALSRINELSANNPLFIRDLFNFDYNSEIYKEAIEIAKTKINERINELINKMREASSKEEVLTIKNDIDAEVQEVVNSLYQHKKSIEEDKTLEITDKNNLLNDTQKIIANTFSIKEHINAGMIETYNKYTSENEQLVQLIKSKDGVIINHKPYNTVYVVLDKNEDTYTLYPFDTKSKLNLDELDEKQIIRAHKDEVYEFQNGARSLNKSQRENIYNESYIFQAFIHDVSVKQQIPMEVLAVMIENLVNVLEQKPSNAVEIRSNFINYFPPSNKLMDASGEMINDPDSPREIAKEIIESLKKKMPSESKRQEIIDTWVKKLHDVNFSSNGYKVDIQKIISDFLWTVKGQDGDINDKVRIKINRDVAIPLNEQLEQSIDGSVEERFRVGLLHANPVKLGNAQNEDFIAIANLEKIDVLIEINLGTELEPNWYYVGNPTTPSMYRKIEKGMVSETIYHPGVILTKYNEAKTADEKQTILDEFNRLYQTQDGDYLEADDLKRLGENYNKQQELWDNFNKIYDEIGDPEVILQGEIFKMLLEVSYTGGSFDFERSSTKKKTVEELFNVSESDKFKIGDEIIIVDTLMLDPNETTFDASSIIGIDPYDVNDAEIGNLMDAINNEELYKKNNRYWLLVKDVSGKLRPITLRPRLATGKEIGPFIDALKDYKKALAKSLSNKDALPLVDEKGNYTEEYKRVRDELNNILIGKDTRKRNSGLYFKFGSKENKIFVTIEPNLKRLKDGTIVNQLDEDNPFSIQIKGLREDGKSTYIRNLNLSDVNSFVASIEKGGAKEGITKFNIGVKIPNKDDIASPMDIAHLLEVPVTADVFKASRLIIEPKKVSIDDILAKLNEERVEPTKQTNEKSKEEKIAEINKPKVKGKERPQVSEYGNPAKVEELQERIGLLESELDALQIRSENIDDLPEVIIANILGTKGFKITPESAKAETGGIKLGQDVNLSFIDKKGKTVEEVAEDLISNDNRLEGMDSQDVRNIIIDILKTGKSEFIKSYNNEDDIKSIVEKLNEISKQLEDEIKALSFTINPKYKDKIDSLISELETTGSVSMSVYSGQAGLDDILDGIRLNPKFRGNPTFNITTEQVSKIMNKITIEVDTSTLETTEEQSDLEKELEENVATEDLKYPNSKKSNTPEQFYVNSYRISGDMGMIKVLEKVWAEPLPAGFGGTDAKEGELAAVQVGTKKWQVIHIPSGFMFGYFPKEGEKSYYVDTFETKKSALDGMVSQKRLDDMRKLQKERRGLYMGILTSHQDISKLPKEEQDLIKGIIRVESVLTDDEYNSGEVTDNMLQKIINEMDRIKGMKSSDGRDYALNERDKEIVNNNITRLYNIKFGKVKVNEPRLSEQFFSDVEDFLRNNYPGFIENGYDYNDWIEIRNSIIEYAKSNNEIPFELSKSGVEFDNNETVEDIFKQFDITSDDITNIDEIKFSDPTDEYELSYNEDIEDEFNEGNKGLQTKTVKELLEESDDVDETISMIINDFIDGVINQLHIDDDITHTIEYQGFNEGGMRSIVIHNFEDPDEFDQEYDEPGHEFKISRHGEYQYFKEDQVRVILKNLLLEKLKSQEIIDIINELPSAAEAIDLVKHIYKELPGKRTAKKKYDSILGKDLEYYAFLKDELDRIIQSDTNIVQKFINAIDDFKMLFNKYDVMNDLIMNAINGFDDAKYGPPIVISGESVIDADDNIQSCFI